MKKLLVLMMVLGMASMASAAIQISVNGALDVDEITIAVSDTITIDIWNAGTGTEFGGQIDFDYYVDFYYPSEGGYTLSNQRLGPAAGDSTDFPSMLKDDSTYPPPSDYRELWIWQGWAQSSTETVGAMYLLDLHCELEGVTVQIDLWDGRNLAAPVDSLIIHQIIPEPMTIALLGLGGLFLRRRK